MVVTFDDGVYTDNIASSPVTSGDFTFTFNQNTGNATAAAVTGLTAVGGGALSGDDITIRFTISNGRLFDARTMNELGNHPRERAKFYWEK